MSKRLPDEFFRQTTSESSDVRAARTRPPRPAGRPRLRRSAGVSGRLVMASALAALLVGYATVRVGMQVSTPVASPTPTVASPTPTGQAPYDGAVVSVLPISAAGSCAVGGGDVGPSLVDSDPTTLWRCPGDGIGERIAFVFPHGTELVGVRLVNGNLSGDAYAAERQILAVRWRFEDGSWLIQPLAADNPADQEVRFPPVVGSVVEMEVLRSSSPGVDDPEHDAVTISRIEFLSRY